MWWVGGVWWVVGWVRRVGLSVWVRSVGLSWADFVELSSVVLVGFQNQGFGVIIVYRHRHLH